MTVLGKVSGSDGHPANVGTGPASRSGGNPPFWMGCGLRSYVAIFRFCVGVMPPLEIIW